MSALCLPFRLALMLGIAAASGESFTCPSKMQGASPGFTCTTTMTCLSAGQARSTMACAFQGTNMDPHSNDQSTNGVPCHQYLGMVKPMMCADNEFMATALENKATLVVAGSAAASGASFTCPAKMQGASPGFKCSMTMTCLSAGQARSTTTCAFQGTNMDPHSNDQPTNGIPCDQYLGMVKPMMCANNEFMAMALEKKATLVVAGSAAASGASFTCPSKMHGASPGFTCTLTMTCLRAGQARSTTTCAFQGKTWIRHQPTNGIPCDQFLGMVKPMMCANNEFMATALEDFKEPGQAWTTTLVVAGSGGASGALLMFALLRSRRFTVREPVLLG